jgi:ATP-binding cassette, subfamily B, multidrug efflux pump
MSGNSPQKRRQLVDLRLLKRIFAFAKPYAGKFRLSVVLTLILAGVSPLRPLLINHTLARVNGVGKEDTGAVIDFLVTITILQVLLVLLEAGLRFYFTYLTSWMGHNVVKDIRVKVYEKILGLNLRQFDKTPIGTLTTRTINDIEAVNDIFSEGLVPILADLLSIRHVLHQLAVDPGLPDTLPTHDAGYLLF